MLADDLALIRTAVLGDGRFERGYAVRGRNRVDVPVSPLVAHLVNRVHRRGGQDTVASLARAVATENGLPLAKVLPPLTAAARILLRDRVFVA